MLARIKLVISLSLFWVVAFQLSRALFYYYQWYAGIPAQPYLLLRAAWHGLRMDLSMVGYLLILPTLLLAFTAQQWGFYKKILQVLGVIASLCIALIVACDLPVYRAWGFRLDATLLHYIALPSEAMASASASPLWLVAFIFFTMFAGLAFLHHKIVNQCILRFEKTSFYTTMPIFLLLAGSLIIPIRGGLQLAPMNQSAVYFSNVSFANQMAINVPWNFFNSVLKATDNRQNDFVVMKKAVADSLLNDLHRQSAGRLQLLGVGSRPNVIFIIWESFTAKAAGVLGGVPGVTPEFDKLAREGILFTNLYASGERSDKGLIAILSGYPAQPLTSIITIPTKTATLPSLPGYFRKQGYFTSFYYGGESEFANIKSYLVQDRFEQIIDKNAFQASELNSKWGAHDHVVFKRFLQDIENQPRPFFSTMFTLSSHEPFDVPAPTIFKGDSQGQKFLNSLHYADASLGEFIRAAKTKSWWDSTLVVIVADHGHPLPELAGGKSPQYHIPMLWLGGALERDSLKVDNLGSQTDLAATLLGQLGHPNASFRWSNDLLQQNRTPYAFFTFNNGFGWITPHGRLVYDNVGRRIMPESSRSQSLDLRRGQAYQQTLIDDYLAR